MLMSHGFKTLEGQKRSKRKYQNNIKARKKRNWNEYYQNLKKMTDVTPLPIEKQMNFRTLARQRYGVEL